MSLDAPRIDHVVINVAGQLNAAQARYRRLGFQLTPRGHHSLGSSNHLAIFDDDYLELLGYEAHNAERAASQWGTRLGLAGLVFKTGDSDALAAELGRRGVPLEAPEPKAFFRPVELPDGSVRDARFRTVRLHPEAVTSGRIFFCHHLDADLVWRKEWQTHPNAVTGIRQVVVESADPAASIEVLRATFGAAAVHAIDGGWRLETGRAPVDYLDAASVRARYGETTPRREGDGDRKVALVLGSASLTRTAAALQAGDIAFVRSDDTTLIVPAIQAAGVALVFVQESPR